MFCRIFMYIFILTSSIFDNSIIEMKRMLTIFINMQILTTHFAFLSFLHAFYIYHFCLVVEKRYNMSNWISTTQSKCYMSNELLWQKSIPDHHSCDNGSPIIMYVFFFTFRNKSVQHSFTDLQTSRTLRTTNTFAAIFFVYCSCQLSLCHASIHTIIKNNSPFVAYEHLLYLFFYRSHSDVLSYAPLCSYGHGHGNGLLLVS